MTWPDRTAADWLTVEDARRRVLALVAPLPPEEVPLPAAPGRDAIWDALGGPRAGSEGSGKC